jgi:ABC-type nitrate/sulfonate/bicarbonate transport system substrate-binding protein
MLLRMISLASILVLAVAVQAAPTERASSGTFSIPAVRNVDYIRNGTAAMLQSYKKYNLKPTQAFSDAFLSEIAVLWKRQDSSATTFQNLNSGSYEYLVAVDIGGETLNLNFDTGSSDLQVYPPPNTSRGK